MTITEPVTLLTDYVLAGVTAWLGWRLWAARETHAARRLWSVAFGALALAALAGGTHHGFTLLLSGTALVALWKVAVLSVGIASFCMLYGSATATTAGGIRGLLLVLAGAKLVLYSLWMLAHDDFVFVIADTGSAMAGIAALHLWSLLRSRDNASQWILGAVGISVLAAAAQAGGYAPHPHFNHNDLYHVIQIVAMILYYKGARLLREYPVSAP